MGDTLLDCCKVEDNTMPLYGINFKAEKTKLYVNLERLFEEHAVNLSLLDDFNMDKLHTQISYMYWEHGKFKDQKEKVRSETNDDYPDSLALACYGQQKAELFQDLPDEFWD